MARAQDRDRFMDDEKLNEKYDKWLSIPRKSSISRLIAIKKLGQYLTEYGLPENTAHILRPRIWKVFLGVHKLEKDEFLGYVEKGPSVVSSKIKNDTFRTLTTDTQFKGKVKEDMLIRLLEAFVWKSESQVDKPFSYVQGMNVLAAPFLYVMPSQLEAFACFSIFIEKHCPLYVQPTLSGVHRGLALLDKCLEEVDKELYEALRAKNLTAEIYAFPSVMTLCACTPPLEEVLKLWDYLLSYGVHHNILAVIAQIRLLRNQLIDSPSPMSILRKLPPLDARAVIDMINDMIPELSDELYVQLACHPTGITRSVKDLTSLYEQVM